MLCRMKVNAMAWRRAVLLTLAGVLMTGCGTASQSAKAETGATPKAALRPDVVAANIDPSVSPGEDFFEYANGGWLKRNPIPASESAWGIGNVVREQLYVNLRKINEEATATPGPRGGDRWKIGNFWSTAMDEAGAERLGIGPLQPELERIDRIASVAAALDAAFAFKPLGVDAFFGLGVSQDARSSAEMAVHLWQGGLGLPDRDFYFNPESGVAQIRGEYVAHIARTLQLLGRSATDARVAAANIVAFETALAGASRALEELRDPVRNYHKMTPTEVTTKHTPSIVWAERLAAYGLRPDTVIVGQPEFLTALDGLLAATPVPVLKDYLRFHLVSEYADFLSKAFDDEHFSFYGRVLSGQQEPRPRWKRVLDAEDAAMGMVLGRVFVSEYFPQATKKRYADLVEAIRTAYRARIDRLEWMDTATKATAQSKLSAMTAKVGYPDQWKDYSALIVGRTSFCENMMNAARWRFDDSVAKFGKPVDRSEWDVPPQTYNAYYSPSNNEIVLPAAIFTIPGFADAEVDDAVVYGYAGAGTIGHEITHGFDDEGRQFDAAGNLADWWSPRDAAEYVRRAQAMVEQFDAYEPIAGLHINGKASLGENIADFGGLLLGLDAFKKTAQFRQGVVVGGLTPLQRYFLGYALGWMVQQREAQLRQQLLSDLHAPAKWRVLGPLSNIPEFPDAFGVRMGQPMWRPEAERVRIW
jgi:putative endopeptidase